MDAFIQSLLKLIAQRFGNLIHEITVLFEALDESGCSQILRKQTINPLLMYVVQLI